MNSRKITALLVCAFSLLVVAGTKVSQLTRTRSLQSTSRFMVSTQDATSGRWSSRYITAPDLATNIGPWITNSGSGTGGSATNAQPPSTTLTNLSGTGVAPGATNAGAYVGSDGGKGTNNQFWGITTNLGLRVTSTAVFDDNVGIGGELNILGYPNVADSLDSLQSRQSGNAVLTNIIATGAVTNIGSALLSASNYYARIVPVTTNDNVSLILSNAQNNTAYILAPGSYAITPSVLSSNLSGGTQYRGITFAGKTNVAILGLKGSTIIDGSSEYGELLVITNCSGITVDGIAFYGKTNHNWTQVIPTNHIWAGIRIANSEKITFQNCDISRHFNHGICDLAANFASVPASTNQIIIQNNLFEDAGSWRTNFPSPFDGTAIVPTGWTVRNNKIKNVFRGIEPYLADNGQPSVIWNCIIENNEIENAYDAGITPAGNTNFHGVRISGNTIRNHPGFAYHGSNALFSSGAAIIWNGGPKWSIDNNIISGAFPYGIQIGGSVVDGSITGNRIADMTNNAAAVGIIAETAYRLKISGNRISGAKASAMYLYGLRDSDVSDNQLVNPSYSGAGIRIATFGANVASNLNIRNNYIFDSVNSRLTYGIEDQLGGTFKIRFSGNDIQNAGTKYFNQSAAEWTIRDLDAGSTNRLIAAHEVRTQLEAGSNITFATNISGVVTITAAAGSGTPGGSSAAVQFNQSGAFAGTNTFVYDRTNNILTAGSFVGNGTGVPIIKLQTMMAADNAFAITVDTNFFGLTNTFNFTNMAVGQRMRVKSVSNGNPTWEVPQLISGVLTNTTSVQADWTGAELIHITNSLIANVVIIPTNMIGGRSLRVIAQASTQTYTLSVSNAAGTVVLYPFASTNGGSAYTVTNGQTVELDLLSLNGKIHAAMGRFQ
jgi:hypothetical protein